MPPSPAAPHEGLASLLNRQWILPPLPHPVQDGSQGAGRCSLTSSVSLNLVFFDNVTDVPSFITLLFPTRMPLTLLGQRLQTLYTQLGICIRCFAIISNSIHSKTEPISFSLHQTSSFFFVPAEFSVSNFSLLWLFLLYCLLPYAVSIQVLDTLFLQRSDISSHGTAPVQALITTFLAQFIEYQL